MLRSIPDVRELNRETIRREVQAHPDFTKSQVSKWTSLSISTCNTILNEMLASGEIRPLAQEEASVGRPATRFGYNADHLHVLGLYVALDRELYTVAWAVADSLGGVLRRGRRSFQDLTFDTVEEVLAEVLAAEPGIHGVALGVPGISTGGVIERCDVESLNGVDAVARVADRFGLDLEIGNDMRFIAKGVQESIETTRGDVAAILFPDNGWVGCGFVVGGKPLAGHSKSAGQLSYVAEAFGFDRQAQLAVLHDRDKLIDLASRLVVVACGTMDPEVVMLIGSQFRPEDVERVTAFCEPIVSASHMPRLLVCPEADDRYIDGLVRIALDSLQFQQS